MRIVNSHHELFDILYELLLRTIPGTVLAKLADMPWLAIILFTVQMAYLLRKWWREETEWGLRMKRLLGVKPSQPGSLE